MSSPDLTNSTTLVGDNDDILPPLPKFYEYLAISLCLVVLFITVTGIVVTTLCCWYHRRTAQKARSVSGDVPSDRSHSNNSIFVTSNVAYKRHKADSDLSFLESKKDLTDFDMSTNIAYTNQSPEEVESPASSVNSSGVHYERIRTHRRLLGKMSKPQSVCHTISSSDSSANYDYVP